MDKVYIPYKLSGKVIDWKSKWFCIGNHAPTLPDRTHGPHKIHKEWSATTQDKDQVNKLLDWIRDLRKDKVTGASVVMSWIGRRIQPLQKRNNFGFHYIGIKDPSRLTYERITGSEAVRRIHQVLDAILGVPTVPDTFTMKDPPKEVHESGQFD